MTSRRLVLDALYRRRRRAEYVGIVALTSSLISGCLLIGSPAHAAAAPVALGAAATYSVLGATGVTSAGLTVVGGDLGVSPSNSIVGFPPGTVDGEIHAGDAPAGLAQQALLLAYADAASRTPTGNFAGDQNGQTFTPGVYHTAAAFALTGTMTLNGLGDANAVFIFQVGAALNTAAASHVNLVNGAKASNVFWQVVGAAGTGAASSFSGTILALGAITIGATGVVIGRALSRGAVTLAANVISPTGTTGSLSITVPATADLGSGQAGTSTSGSVGAVRIVDSRAPGTVSWIATVSSTNLTTGGGSAAETILKGSVRYWSGGATASTGDVTTTPGQAAAGDAQPMSAARTAFSATGTATNSTTWNPTVIIDFPIGIVAGVYAATMTHSVA